ncbi:hypothetical protein, variant [Saprolegnia diclina VS20]|uniref:F-box/LRR-repeat protein 15-like leucin rich repeat domain-containing protein n=1 Tax=Saprolegnia diclina (strain VS20) TaxID=1156394 RepID=T0SAT5_SAPDV|nr:hypothetical protein, variant [Saprolegnia diclina VS20]EQC39942.1 hypothetical protein, variant [Saprolegnia diclina VS20]|eukprot:XP_008606416.1 hypothetical protein, variant [Saprolegnia diclina VS20]
MGIVCSSTESVVESHDVRAPKHCRTKNPSQPQHRRRLPLGSSTLVELCLDRLAIEVASAPASVDTAVLPPELFGALLRRLVAHEALTADLFARLGESLPLGTRVDLTDCADVDTGWLQALAPSITASLMHIDLTRCTGVETLGREPLAALRVAKLSHCKNMSPLALHPLSNATHLSVLHLAGCALLRNESLGHLLSCTQLTDLDLSQCPSISDTGLFALPPSLRRLNLSQCSGISDRGVLAVVTGLASLLSLNLGLCNITNGALAMLAVHAHQLQHLVLSGCRAVDQAGVNLLDSLSELVSFEASQCRLVQSPHRAWASLTFLDLSTSGVNDTGLAVRFAWLLPSYPQLSCVGHRVAGDAHIPRCLAKPGNCYFIPMPAIALSPAVLQGRAHQAQRCDFSSPLRALDVPRRAPRGAHRRLGHGRTRSTPSQAPHKLGAEHRRRHVPQLVVRGLASSAHELGPLWCKHRRPRSRVPRMFAESASPRALQRLPHGPRCRHACVLSAALDGAQCEPQQGVAGRWFEMLGAAATAQNVECVQHEHRRRVACSSSAYTTFSQTQSAHGNDWY